MLIVAAHEVDHSIHDEIFRTQDFDFLLEDCLIGEEFKHYAEVRVVFFNMLRFPDLSDQLKILGFGKRKGGRDRSFLVGGDILGVEVPGFIDLSGHHKGSLFGIRLFHFKTPFDRFEDL